MTEPVIIFVDNDDFDPENIIIATWNVNSLKCRLDKVLDWLRVYKPLVLTLQEIKSDSEKIDKTLFWELGYEIICHSKGGWNGVAIAYRDIDRMDFKTRVLSTRYDLENQPSWNDGKNGAIIEARALAIELEVEKLKKKTVFNIYSLYVPNGRTIIDDHFIYKLFFLDCLKEDIKGKTNLILTGDFNVAPRNDDVWSVKNFIGCTHVTPEERHRIEALGLRDVIPEYGLEDGERKKSIFSYWGYIGGLFYRDKGMRIDLVLTNTEKVVSTYVDRDTRKLAKTSDHAPLIAKLKL